MQKIDRKFHKLCKALAALEDIYLDPPGAKRTNIDATIKRFELTFEPFWKFLKEFFKERGIVLEYPSDVFKEAFSHHLIDDEKIWIQMLRDRNSTAHAYDEETACGIYACAVEFLSRNI